MNDITGTLLLSRKEGENVVIQCGNEMIIVHLEAVTSGKAKIRFSASQDVKIYREELYKKENCIFTIKR